MVSRPGRTETLPLLEPSHGHEGARHMVVIFNNETNLVEEVIAVLMLATGCDYLEASTETWEAHHLGSAPVHFAAENECHRVAQVIARIGVATEVRPEWND